MHPVIGHALEVSEGESRGGSAHSFNRITKPFRG